MKIPLQKLQMMRKHPRQRMAPPNKRMTQKRTLKRQKRKKCLSHLATFGHLVTQAVIQRSISTKVNSFASRKNKLKKILCRQLACRATQNS